MVRWLVVASVVALGVFWLAAGDAAAQQTTIGTPFRSANEGFYYTSGLYTGCYVETSKLHFGSPGRLKALNRLTVTLDRTDADLVTTIKYKIDGANSWTTAGTGTNETRTSVDLAALAFYTLEVRVELSETTGDTDVAIDSVSVVYSIDEGSRRSLGERA